MACEFVRGQHSTVGTRRKACTYRELNLDGLADHLLNRVQDVLDEVLLGHLGGIFDLRKSQSRMDYKLVDIEGGLTISSLVFSKCA